MQVGHGLPSPAPGLNAAPVDTPQYPCPICKRTFKRTQERNRHLRAFLPHRIYCTFPQCPYRGDRHENLVTHWKEKHSHTNGGQAPQQQQECQIYDCNQLVTQVISGDMTMENAIADALSKVETRAQMLGKEDQWAGNWWGRHPGPHVYRQ